MVHLPGVHWYYLVVLVVSWLGLLGADWRWRLVWWRYPKAALTCLLMMVPFFFLWDAVGVWLRIFFTNQSLVVGWWLGSPNLPIEELLFLALLVYTTIIFYQLSLRTE